MSAEEQRHGTGEVAPIIINGGEPSKNVDVVWIQSQRIEVLDFCFPEGLSDEITICAGQVAFFTGLLRARGSEQKNAEQAESG